MKIPKAFGTNNSLGTGKMLGQTVPMMRPPIATSQPNRSGFIAQGSLVGHVAAVLGSGTPAHTTMRDASFKRPHMAPAGKNQYGRWMVDYSPKSKI